MLRKLGELWHRLTGSRREASGGEQTLGQTQAQRQAALFRLSAELAATLDESEVCRRVVHGLRDTLGYDIIALYLVEEGTGDRILAARAGYPDAPDRIPKGQGLSERPIMDGQLYYTPDVSQDPRYVGSWCGSEVDVPIPIGEEVLGVLIAEKKELGAFTQEDFEVLTAATQQAGLAIEKARLLAAERKRADELEALRSTLTDITAELELSKLLEVIVARAASLLHATGGELGLYDETNQELHIVVSYNLGSHYVGRYQALGEGAMGSVAATCEPLIIDDYQTWEGRLAEYSHVHTTLVVPLVIGNRLLGVFSTASTEPSRRFTPADLHLLNLFARQASIAIENARLYDQAQQVAILEERQRLARELHDSVAQALYGVIMYAEAAARLLVAGKEDPALDYMLELRNTALDALREMRMLIFELLPPVLEEMGLVAALQTRLEAVEGRAGLKTAFTVDGLERLEPAIEQGLYRIALEALNNTLRHSQAKHLSLHLVLNKPLISLQVRDDGIGFDPAVAREQGGLGLRGMYERAEQIGGRLSVTSKPGEGTTIYLEVGR
jgi:signal transduction histidine kinase